MRGKCRAGREFDEDLDGLAPGGAEVLAEQVIARDAGRGLRGAKSYESSAEKHQADVTGSHELSPASAACTKEMQAEPSPTAAATRLVLPERTSPTANTPGMLVSRK